MFTAINADRCMQDTKTAFTTDLLHQYETRGEGFPLQTVTRVHHSEPESKKDLIEKQQTTSPRKNKFKSLSSVGKIMVTDFWDDNSINLVGLIPKETRVNSNCYTETLRSLNACLCWVHPTTKMSSVLLLHDDARLHKYVHERP